MTETERLRAMLDELGVEHIKFDSGYRQTRWVWNGESMTMFSEHTNGFTELHIQDYTPEQAIEATLGRGECELTHTRDKPRSKAPTLTCSECGWWTDRINDEWRYCPRCGKRVKA